MRPWIENEMHVKLNLPLLRADEDMGYGELKYITSVDQGLRDIASKLESYRNDQPKAYSKFIKNAGGKHDEGRYFYRVALKCYVILRNGVKSV